MRSAIPTYVDVQTFILSIELLNLGYETRKDFQLSSNENQGLIA